MHLKIYSKAAESEKTPHQLYVDVLLSHRTVVWGDT